MENDNIRLAESVSLLVSYFEFFYAKEISKQNVLSFQTEVCRISELPSVTNGPCVFDTSR